MKWKALPGETLDDRLGENVRSFETVFCFAPVLVLIKRHGFEMNKCIFFNVI
jgi:hypothetical protein